MDNGINIKDPLVRHISINTTSRTQFCQMLGRVRVNKDNPKALNLYIPAESANKFNYMLNKYVFPVLEAVNLYNTNVIEVLHDYFQCKDKNDSFRNYFYFDAEKLKINYPALFMNQCKKEFYENTIKRFEEDSKDAFIKIQLEWLGLKETYDPGNYLDANKKIMIKEELKKYLDSYCNKIIDDKNQITCFRKRISDDYKSLTG